MQVRSVNCALIVSIVCKTAAQHLLTSLFWRCRREIDTISTARSMFGLDQLNAFAVSFQPATSRFDVAGHGRTRNSQSLGQLGKTLAAIYHGEDCLLEQKHFQNQSRASRTSGFACLQHTPKMAYAIWLGSLQCDRSACFAQRTCNFIESTGVCYCY